MVKYLAIAIFVLSVMALSSPFRILLNCGPNNEEEQLRTGKTTGITSSATELCNLIQKSLLQMPEDGEMNELEEDQFISSQDQMFAFAIPPDGFLIPKSDKASSKRRRPKLKVPAIGVPNLSMSRHLTKIKPPKIANAKTPRYQTKLRKALEEDSSVERTEKIQKLLKKMQHFVKIVGEIDKYVSERVKIFVETLSRVVHD